MSEREIKNAKITSADICFEDHGFLTIYIGLDYGGSGQSFGGYALGGQKGLKAREQNVNACGMFITRVLEVAGVHRWDQLVGKTVRADCDWGKIHRIGHILDDDWFNPVETFEALKNKDAA